MSGSGLRETRTDPPPGITLYSQPNSPFQLRGDSFRSALSLFNLALADQIRESSILPMHGMALLWILATLKDVWMRSENEQLYFTAT